MSSNPAHTNSKQNVTHKADENAASVDEVVSVEQVETTSTQTQENHHSRIDLPQPDAENITVLTNKLPNKPILPWNRYDSPWKEAEHEEETTEESARETTTSTDRDTETENSGSESQESNTQGQTTSDR